MARMRTRGLWWPLWGFLLPTLGIGFGWVIPRSCVATTPSLIVGFASTVAGACLTYVIGVRLALRAAAEGAADDQR